MKKIVLGNIEMVKALASQNLNGLVLDIYEDGEIYRFEMNSPYYGGADWHGKMEMSKDKVDTQTYLMSFVELVEYLKKELPKYADRCEEVLTIVDPQGSRKMVKKFNQKKDAVNIKTRPVWDDVIFKQKIEEEYRGMYTSRIKEKADDFQEFGIRLMAKAKLGQGLKNYYIVHNYNADSGSYNYLKECYIETIREKLPLNSVIDYRSYASAKGNLSQVVSPGVNIVLIDQYTRTEDAYWMVIKLRDAVAEAGGRMVIFSDKAVKDLFVEHKDDACIIAWNESGKGYVQGIVHQGIEIIGFDRIRK